MDSLRERHEACCQQAEAAEGAREALQKELNRLAMDHEAAQANVRTLEKQVEEGAHDRGEEVERCRRLIGQLKDELETAQERERVAEETVSESGCEGE